MNTDLRKEGLEELPPENWLYQYLQYTDRQESPTCFHVWTGLSTLASTIQRKLSVDRGFYTLYANQYIVLVAKSALCRKSTALKLGSNLLEVFELTKIIKESITKEKLYLELANQKGRDNALTILAPELSVLLGANAFSGGLIPVLTTLYDSPEKSENLTKTAGDDKLKNVCINISAATTTDWMTNNLPADAIEGGFTGRVIFIGGEKPRCSNAWPTLSPEENSMRSILTQRLQLINSLVGRFTIEEETKNYYKEWYDSQKEPDDARLSGYHGRKGDHVIKIAMALSSGDKGRISDNLIIEKWHISTSLSLLDKAEKLMHIAFGRITFSKSSKDIDRILDWMKKARERGRVTIKHSDLLRVNSRYLNAKEFKEVIATLEEQKSIKVILDMKTGKSYTLIGEG